MKAIYVLLILLSFNSYSKDTFFDKYGRVHDKKVVDGNPSSNNGWLYSAIYKKLGGELSIPKEIGNYCAKNRKRNPSSITGKDIPISRDEILGLAYLGYLKKEDLDGWNFSPYKLKKFNLFKFINQASELVDSFFPFKLKHRNYFWQNNLEQIYHIAFTVPIQDRHFLLKTWGEYNLFYHIVHIIDALIPTKDRSIRQIKFLKHGKDIESIFNYYKKYDHPSVILSKNKK